MLVYFFLEGQLLYLIFQTDESAGHYAATSLINLAGLPAYIPGFVISLVTTEPAPITTRPQIFTGSTVALLPIET